MSVLLLPRYRAVDGACRMQWGLFRTGVYYEPGITAAIARLLEGGTGAGRGEWRRGGDGVLTGC